MRRSPRAAWCGCDAQDALFAAKPALVVVVLVVIWRTHPSTVDNRTVWSIYVVILIYVLDLRDRVSTLRDEVTMLKWRAGIRKDD